METLPTCLICATSSAGARLVYQRKDDRLVRCPGCGLVYANPQYTEAELVPLYVSHYYNEKTVETDFYDVAYQRWNGLNVAVLRDIVRRYPRLRPGTAARRVLDFGSGVGLFLVAAREAGFVPMGIEFSEAAARHARDHFGIETHVDPERTVDELPAGHFHLITAWQVVEHLRRPRDMLTRLVRLLAPGGVLCVAVPNIGSWRSRLDGARWFNVENPTHLAFYSRENLGRLLRDMGLVHTISPAFWGGSPDLSAPGHLAQYIVRLSGFGQDLRVYAEKPGVIPAA